MCQSKKKYQRKHTQKAGKHTRGNACKDGFPIFLKYRKLVIERNGQGNGCRGEQIAQVFSPFVVGVIINMKELQKSNGDENGDQKGIENAKSKAFL